mmetsp:Transcript_18097/g.29354  ORF Transcript_18097/g.29354 Transcript_18097/m.29354 type:complete len:637 (-) Transcript_18097:2587-4497(-)
MSMYTMMPFRALGPQAFLNFQILADQSMHLANARMPGRANLRNFHYSGAQSFFKRRPSRKPEIIAGRYMHLSNVRAWTSKTVLGRANMRQFHSRLRSRILADKYKSNQAAAMSWIQMKKTLPGLRGWSFKSIVGPSVPCVATRGLSTLGLVCGGFLWLALQHDKAEMSGAPCVRQPVAVASACLSPKTLLGALISFGKDLIRTLQLLFTFFPCLALWPLWMVIPFPEQYCDWWIGLFVQCLQRGGPTFVKLGQWASTRSDLFDQRWRSHFRVLQDQCTLEPAAYTLATLNNAVGPDALGDFELEPIGSGCIAQVHKARVKSSGQIVAVKIQRYGIRDMIRRDLSLLNRCVSLVSFVLPRQMFESFGIEEASQRFGEFMLSQLDFEKEAENLTRFSQNFERSDHTVSFPTPLYVSPSGTVLVESFEQGVSLGELLYDKQCSQSLKKEIGRVCVRAFLKMVLVDNFSHSDLHPGNVLVEIDPCTDKLNMLTFVDVGLTTTLDENDRDNFIDLFAAVATGNGRLAGELMVDRCDPRKLNKCTDRERFVEGIEQVVSKVSLESFTLDKVQIGRVLEQVLTLVHVYRVPIDAKFTNLVLGIIVLEGMGKQLDPSLDIFKEFVPILLGMDRSNQIAAIRALF